MSSVIKYLTQSEVERLFKKIDSKRDKALFMLMYYHGLRVGEVTQLQIDELDFDNNRITIRALKNGIQGQHVLSPQVKSSIKQYFDERCKKRVYTNIFFLSQKKCQLSNTQVYLLFRKYAEKAKIPNDKRHPHCLRHSIAVHLAEGGVPIEQVQEILRHRSIQNTRIYFEFTNRKRDEIQRNAYKNAFLAQV